MTRPERRGWGWWVLTAAWMTGITVASAQPGGQVGLPPGVDKVAHFLEYAVLGYLSTRATRAPLTGFLVAAVFGATDEVHQAFVPGREPGLGDWMADLAGGFVGARLAAEAARAARRA